jgi:hypothetical protein
LTESKSKLSSPEVAEGKTSTVGAEDSATEEGTEEDSEEAETETTASGNTTTEDPEETLVTDQRDASTAKRRVTSLRTANNVTF